MAIPFFDLTRQNQAVRPQLDAAIGQVVDSARFILGGNVAQLEKEFADYCGTKFAIGVASGTDALHLALKACGIKDGDEVITTPFTFVATAEAIAYCGAKPVFVDIEPNTFNIDPSLIAKKISKKTRAILPVHLYGLAANMTEIVKVAQEHGLKVVEDCAQATGAAIGGRKVGCFGDTGCFSFFPTKNLGCFGDGGMITTNDEKVAEEVKVLRGHGSRKTYHYDMIGYNSRLDELQAAVLRAKLPLLDNYIVSRQKRASIYYKHFKELKDLSLPHEPKSFLHTYNQYTVMVEDRNGLFEYLKTKAVGAMVYYPLALHLQKAFVELKHRAGDFPACEKVQDRVLSLPIFPELTDQEAEEAAHVVASYFDK